MYITWKSGLDWIKCHRLNCGDFSGLDIEPLSFSSEALLDRKSIMRIKFLSGCGFGAYSPAMMLPVSGPCDNVSYRTLYICTQLQVILYPWGRCAGGTGGGYSLHGWHTNNFSCQAQWWSMHGISPALTWWPPCRLIDWLSVLYWEGPHQACTGHPGCHLQTFWQSLQGDCSFTLPFGCCSALLSLLSMLSDSCLCTAPVVSDGSNQVAVSVVDCCRSCIGSHIAFRLLPLLLTSYPATVVCTLIRFSVLIIHGSAIWYLALLAAGSGFCLLQLPLFLPLQIAASFTALTFWSPACTTSNT